MVIPSLLLSAAKLSTISYCHRTSSKVPPSLSPLQALVVFVLIATLVDLRRLPAVVELCISPMVNAIAHLLMRLLAVCLSSPEKCLLNSLLFKTFVYPFVNY